MAVFKRGKYFHYEFQIDCQQYRGSTKQTTLGKAKQFEAVLRTKIQETGGHTFVKKAALLSDVVKKFLREIDAQTEAGNLDPDTRRMYHNGWRMLKATEIANMRVNRITTAVAASLEFPGGPWNARQGQATLSRILNWAAQEGIIIAAPRIKRTRAYGRQIRITHEIEAALLAHMERDVADVFLIMLDCGMRPEEVLRMRWEHVHWDRSEYFNPYGKTEESRRFVPISDRMQATLRRREELVAGSAWVFPRGKIAPLTVLRANDMFSSGSSIRQVSIALDLSWPMAKDICDGKVIVDDKHRMSVAKQFEAARDAARLDSKIVLYCARHEFATTYLEHGGDLATLKKLMGHSSLAVTEKYLHPGIAGAADVINRRNRRTGLHVVKSA